MTHALLLSALMTAATPAEDLGLRLPPGFQISVYADESLANDIYAMTLDAGGRVVFTSKGFVKVLHDDDQDGKADRSSLFTETESGGMGLCFDGPDLLFCGDGWFSRYRDADGNGQADGPPERIAPLKFGEHGAHAMRKGPDGWWYLVVGNSSGLGPQHATMPHSPVKKPEAGAFLRFSPDLKQSEIVVHGLRNPYDFDFNPAGDLLTYDSDVERVYFLPWYVPTRIYHVAHAGHHGWRLDGHLRSWARPGDYLDTVDVLQPIGRGSPTGVTCYRHDQFPEHYRGGLFALDWTFGKVYFLPLKPEGASYRTGTEVFIESIGTHGFDPTDAVVAPDGSLLVSMGGRRTRGSVYRIEYVGEDRASDNPAPASDLNRVLDAPQPLDAWSRAVWEPIALRLGPGPFASAVADETLDESSRVRAVEVLTELFGGLPPEAARDGAKSASAPVRSRAAWSIGRVSRPESAPILDALAADHVGRVRVAALDALGDRSALCDGEILAPLAGQNLDHPEKRVRQAAARLASLLPETPWGRIRSDLSNRGSLQARLSGALAACWRTPDETFHESVAEEALAIFDGTTDPDLRLQAIRLLMIALGDYHLNDPAVEVETGYSLQPSLAGREPLIRRILDTIGPRYEGDGSRLDQEEARLLAMLEADDPELPRKVAGLWTESSSPSNDMHYLVAFSRLKGTRTSDLTPRVAQAVLGLSGKLQGKEQRNKQVWNERLAELVTGLTHGDPRLAEALLNHPLFPQPGHVALAASFPDALQDRAARVFLKAVQADPSFPWSGPLIDLFARLPVADVRPLFRSQWDNYGLRDALLLQFARSPEEADREAFLTGLDSAEPRVVQASLNALMRLPRDPSPEHMVPALLLLRRLVAEPKQLGGPRKATLALLARQSGEPAEVDEDATSSDTLKPAYTPIFDAFARRHPDLSKALDGPDAEDLAAWSEVLRTVDWSQGDSARGEALFRARACQTCHSGDSRIGPDLTGVTGRFSREDLFTAIVAPNREVAPPYRTTLVETRDGQLVAGIVAFYSADGLILQTGATGTQRIASEDIVQEQPGQNSLMPTGLLKDLKPADLADLDRYLRTLQPPNQEGGIERGK